MLDIKFIRENPSLIQKAAENKGVRVNIDHLLEIDRKYRELSQEVQALREERNKYARLLSPNAQAIGGQAKEKNIEKGKELKIKLEKEENALKAIEEELDLELIKVPNPAKKDVKEGKDETENEILRKEGNIPSFDFSPKDHLELGVNLDIIDIERASKISGTRFYFLKNEGVLLEFALKQYAFEVLMGEGFIPVLPPVLIKKDVMKGLGYMESGGDEEMYIFDKDELVLVGTSEQSIVPMHKDEMLDVGKLPLRYVGFSTCFRREAGSYGKDTKGILRAHQFDKVEMVSYVKEGDDDREHLYLLSIEERFLKDLKLPYQVVKMCTGDLGFPAARIYDLEGWIPSQNKYRELTSTSTTTDFQSRRLNIKAREKNKTSYVSILNGTAFSTRPIIAILENYQQKDGSVEIPKVLQKFTKFTKISPKK